jgi:ribokinase
MARIAVVGSSNTDMVVRVPHLPAPGETILGGTFRTAQGGKGANQAVAAARAGGTISFVGCLGGDALGDAALDALREEAIDVRGVFREEDAPSGVAMIYVDDAGENCIAVAPGANERLSPRHLERVRDLLAAAEAILVQLEIPQDTVAAVVRIARAARVPLVLNPAPARPLPARLLRGLPVLTPNERELYALAGLPSGTEAGLDDAVTALLGRGVRTVVVTRGARGAYAATAEERFPVAGFGVEAVDTTGAGDVFNGALAVALAERRALPEAVRFANAAAALSVTRPSAQPSIPRREEILALLDRDGRPIDGPAAATRPD